MSMMVSFVLSFFPRDVLDEILNLIESVSEDFPSYSFIVSRPDHCRFTQLVVFLVDFFILSSVGICIVWCYANLDFPKYLQFMLKIVSYHQWMKHFVDSIHHQSGFDVRSEKC